MENLFAGIIYLSIAGTLAISFYLFKEDGNRRNLLIRIAIIAVASFAIYQLFLADDGLTARSGGDENDGWYVAVMYFFVVLGMGANYGFNYFYTAPGERPPFDWGQFLAPVFISPLIFLPLYMAFTGAEVDLAANNQARWMTFFISFQNGFFWKDAMEKYRKSVAKDKIAELPTGKEGS